MKKHILILIVFAGLAIILTYPLVLSVREAVYEPGDSLFNAWTIYWDLKALLRDPLNIFHTNIFYPYRYTLAYSEHMIGTAIMALPLYLFIKNPLFIYNCMLFFSFAICGFGAYLLTYYLTKDRISGVVSGAIFAFCPYRFEQMGHLHILTSQWIPLALLSLHISSSIDRGSFKKAISLISFGFFFVLQFLCSGHNGLYLAVAVLLYLLYFRRETDYCPWLVLIIAGIFILPFYYPYSYLAREYGFTRQMYEFKLYSPQIDSYFAVPDGNWLYGEFLSKFGRPEAVMFPGLMALFLAFWKKIPKISIGKINPLLNFFILLVILLIIIIFITGGIDLHRSILGIKLKVTGATRPVFILVLICAIKIFKDREEWRKRIDNLFLSRSPEKFYWILAIFAFTLSFGPVIKMFNKDIAWGPYNLLYDFVPGFKGLRVSGRIYTLFILALSVLAGFGVKRIKDSFPRFRYFIFLIPFMVLAEYVNIPIIPTCGIGTNPYPAYRWIAEKKGDFAIIELPMPDWYDKFSHEIQYVYWSIYHDKKLVNGYSGYSPPIYWIIAEKMKDFPNDDAIEMLRYMDVKYLIIHQGEIDSWGWPSVAQKADNYKDALKLVFKEGDDYVYELQRAVPYTGKGVEGEQGVALRISGISTNYNQEDIYKAIDNNPATRWHSGTPQKPGIFVELDLGDIKSVNAVSVEFNLSPTDYPRGLKLEGSVDGKVLRDIPVKFIYANYVKHLLKYPKDSRMALNFESTELRFIRITQTGDHDKFFWSIYELGVYEAKN